MSEENKPFDSRITSIHSFRQSRRIPIMAPNVHHESSTLLAAIKTSHNVEIQHCSQNDDQHLEKEPELISESTKSILCSTPKEVGRKIWKSILDGSQSSSMSELRIQQALSSIRILGDCNDNRDFLDQFGGSLLDLSLDLISTLKKKSPEHFNALVADFNDNLWYDMQDQRGLEFLGLSSCLLQETLKAKEYLGSFLTTERSVPQPPHVDYTWEILEKYSPNDLQLAFFPLTEEGMFLQVWPRNDDMSTMPTIPGQLIYIPHGKLLILPAHTIHGGGFRTTPNVNASNKYGNLRFHLYIARNQAKLPEHQTNKYTEPKDKRKELAYRYVDAPMMTDLLDCLFV